MLVPLPFNGTIKEFKQRKNLHPGYNWINLLPDNKSVYLSLFKTHPISYNYNLPLNYDVYVVSFHLEAVDINWIKSQVSRVNSEIIVLFDGKSNNYTLPRVRFLSYYYWHIQLHLMTEWFGRPQNTTKKITHKASAFCNRITNAKLIVFTALAEYIGTENSMLVLNNRTLEKDNVYDDEENIPKIIKTLSNKFFTEYYGNKYTVDNFTDDLNQQKHTANPFHPAYQNCALHFTNESFDTSDIFKSSLYLHPGPFITEKTLKCLLGGTAFIPVGQFDTYGELKRVGFKFDYNLDTSFDSIEQDTDRLVAIVELIKTLQNVSMDELYKGTCESSEFNVAYVNSGEFYKECEELNQYTINEVMEHIDLVTN